MTISTAAPRRLLRRVVQIPLGLRALLGWTTTMVLVVILAPGVLSPYSLSVLLVVLMTLPGAVALNIVFGMCGQVSIGNAAFLAVGAFGAATIVRHAPDLPPLVVVLACGAICAFVGLLVGAPAARLRGLFLLISTLAFHYIAMYSLERYQSSVVGEIGFAVPSFAIFGWTAVGQSDWLIIFGVLSALSLGLMSLLRHGRLGRSWLAIREHELVATSVGISVSRAKLLAFVISSALIGMQGALIAYYSHVVQYETFTFLLAVQYIAMVIIGGLGTVAGTVIGTTCIVSLPYVLQSLSDQWSGQSGVGRFVFDHLFELQNIVYGGLITLFILLAPGGLHSIVRGAGQSLIKRVTRSAPPADSSRRVPTSDKGPARAEG